jgi:putative ABC transport system substrate-binding protein
MDRRSFFRTAATVLLVVGRRANAAALPRVAFVHNNAPISEVADDRNYKAFARGLRERGFEEGRNIIVVRLSAEGRYDRFPQLMEELVATSVDVIVAIGPGVGAAMRATRTIPIVAVGTDGLVESGAVASLGRPGGNVTGLTGETGGVELATKRLQLLREAAPRASRVAFLGYGLRSVDASQGPSFESAGRALGQTIVWAHFRTPQDLKPAFATIEKEQADALYVEAVPVTYLHLRDIVDLAARLKLPAMYEMREGPEQGGLMSYGSDLADLFSRAASFVDRILKGAKPGDLPVEQPTRFELILNRGAAKTLGIIIPPTLLQRTDAFVG